MNNKIQGENMNSFYISGTLMNDFKVSDVGEKKVAKGKLIIKKKISKAKKEELESKGYPTADFLPIEVWGSAQKINMLTHNVMKGDRLECDASMQTGKYQNNEGKTIYTTTFNVQDFDFTFKPKEEIEEMEI